MVMDDLTLKGVMDPSSIWTVICMLVDGNEAFEMLFSERQYSSSVFREFGN